MSTEVIDNKVKPEDVAFWMSMVSLVGMSVLFLAKAGHVLVDFSFLILTTAGLLGLVAAFCFGLHASLKGRPGQSAVKHLIFSLFMAVMCLLLYVAGYNAFEFITSCME
jgi:hypothetical protein